MGIVEEAMEVTRLVVEEALCGGSLTERSVMMVARASRLVPKECVECAHTHTLHSFPVNPVHTLVMGLTHKS